ncbi:MAG: SO2930 family diheme c-type cytochrome [Erythrobacter sp.]
MRHWLLFLAACCGLAGAISARTPAPVNDAAILDGTPRMLSEFRFFFRPRSQSSHSAIPYELRTPLYSDGADKLRFAYIPAGEQAIADGDGLLQFPVGSALIKTFAFGEGPDRRLIETRVLLHREAGWVALPYIWNDEQTDARLALAGGRIALTRPDGAEISYRIPNKNQCKQCHVKDGAVIPIGPKARNLSAEWLEQAVEWNRLDQVPDVERRIPNWQTVTDHHAEADEASGGADIDAFARGYLDVNCAHCHMPGGSASNSGLDLRWEQDDPVAYGVHKPPVAAGRGAGGLLVSIEPGAPERSILFHRMASTEPGVAMPELGKSTVDDIGLEVIRTWISAMETQ